MINSSTEIGRGLLIFGGVLSALGGIEILLGSPAVDWLPTVWFGIVCGFVGGWIQFLESSDVQPPVGTVFEWATAIGGILLVGFAAVLTVGFGRLTVRIAGVSGVGFVAVVFISGRTILEWIGG